MAKTHAEIPVTLTAWLRVEDGNVTGIDLRLDDVELNEDDLRHGVTGFWHVRPGDPDSPIPDLTVDETHEVFNALPPRRDWKIRRVEDSDGRVYLDGEVE